MKEVKEEPVNVNNRDENLTQTVHKQHKARCKAGQFETIEEIFSRLPLPRLEKRDYTFLFETIKSNVENSLQRQDRTNEIKKTQHKQVSKIELKNFKTPIEQLFPSENALANQRLRSNAPLFKSLIYLRNQQDFGLEVVIGDDEPFIPDDQYLNLATIKKDINNLRLLMEGADPIRSQRFQFVNENTLDVKQKNFPSSYEINKRAEVLAKLYLLKLYRQEKRKVQTQEKVDELQLNKQREINKIKQEMEIEKMKEGELIDQMDLIKQVYKILNLLQVKMNSLAFEQFSNQNGDRATQIKRSLQKLKQNINSQPVAKNKLRMLISYKHKKGW